MAFKRGRPYYYPVVCVCLQRVMFFFFSSRHCTAAADFNDKFEFFPLFSCSSATQRVGESYPSVDGFLVTSSRELL